MHRRDPPAPVPPRPLPPGRVVLLPGRGEVFVRDTEGPQHGGLPVLLLHGWMFSADTNWYRSYDALRAAGHRVIALDHRGHGRGLRSAAPFRLTDCAADAAALVDHLGCGPVVAVGYSMGGPVAQLLARHHRTAVRGLVLCATAAAWRDPRQRRAWRALAVLRLLLGLAPTSTWRLMLARAPKGAAKSWLAAELSRGSARDIAEAGRELSRYDARPWLGGLDVPAAVVVTTKDDLVPPRHQRELAVALGARRFEVHADHLAAGTAAERFLPALLEAVATVNGR